MSALRFRGVFLAGALRGFSAYEAQVGPLYVRIVHLRGDYWHRRPWRRLNAGLDLGWWRSVDA